MTRIFRLIKFLFHLIKAFYRILRYFKMLDPQKKALSTFQRTLISDWFYELLQILNISLYVQENKQAKPNLLPKSSKTSTLTVNKTAKIIVANHISWLDVVILGYLFPTRFIAKSEISQWPLISLIIKKIGTFFINRGRITELKSLSRHIKYFLNEGESLTFFPEGKTGKGDTIQPIYSGLFQIAIDTEKEIQPVFLSYKDSSYPSKIIPYIDDNNILVNIWHIAGLEDIKLYALMGDIISVQNKNRKDIANEVKSQLSKMLKQQLSTVC